MKPLPQGTKPADPQLQEARPRQPRRPPEVSRWFGAALYALFSFILIAPLVRRWRRERWWSSVRLGLALLGAAAATAWASGWIGAIAGGVGVAALLLGLALGPLKDPDAERKLQRKHGAQYLLNGGVQAGGRLGSSPPLDSDRALYLLIRSPHLMLVPRETGEVQAAIDIGAVERIEVGGRLYVPVYVSEAKDPPVRESAADRNAATDLKLITNRGDEIVFRYRGAFHKHLAETAAHGIYSVREELRRTASDEALRVLTHPTG